MYMKHTDGNETGILPTLLPWKAYWKGTQQPPPGRQPAGSRVDECPRPLPLPQESPPHHTAHLSQVHRVFLEAASVLHTGDGTSDGQATVFVLLSIWCSEGEGPAIING